MKNTVAVLWYVGMALVILAIYFNLTGNIPGKSSFLFPAFFYLILISIFLFFLVVVYKFSKKLPLYNTFTYIHIVTSCIAAILLFYLVWDGVDIFHPTASRYYDDLHENRNVILSGVFKLLVFGQLILPINIILAIRKMKR